MFSSVQCYTCGQTIPEEDQKAGVHNCPMKEKLDPTEQFMVGALLVSDFCDHFCCDLSENACRAKAIVHYLRQYGLLKDVPPEGI